MVEESHDDEVLGEEMFVKRIVRTYLAERIKAFENGQFQDGPDPFTLITGSRGTGKSSFIFLSMYWSHL